MLKTVSSITNAIGALNYKGTWNASTNSPTLTSSVGTKGDYYVIGTAGSTSLDGISNWGIGDWAAFNGSVWQRVEGGANLNGVDLSVSGTSTLSGLTASTALALDASKNIVSVTNTGTGNNVLDTSPSIATPTLSGDVQVSTGSLVLGTSGKGLASTGTIICQSTSAGIDWAVYSAASPTNPAYFIQGPGTVNGIGTGANGAAAAMYVNRDTGSLRSINAAGSVNAAGLDYAEYMIKDGDFVIAKGDVCGINENGKLTNVFAEAISFVVKSTEPAYVGGDNWFNEQPPQPPVELTVPNEDATDEAKSKYETDLVTYNSDLSIYTADLASWKQRLEAARAPVDRIAFCGQVPVNVQGATPGQFIIAVNDNGAIKGQAISNPTFEQYQAAVGKVIAIEADGRAKIIVKIS
jgi:hypothetical protein